MSEHKEFLCPRGHHSTEADYCSACGARMEGGVVPDVPSQDVVLEGGRCPDCGTLREEPKISFCEVCGFNFVTGAHGEIGILPAEAFPWAEEGPDRAPEMRSDPAVQEGPKLSPGPDADPDPSTALSGVRLLVSLDTAREEPDAQESAPAPQAFAVELAGGSHLIGRPNSGRGTAPEIVLGGDDAVSRRHAVIEAGTARGVWVVRDLGSANGTRLNGQDMETMRDYAVQSGDELTLGHGTRIRIEAL